MATNNHPLKPLIKGLYKTASNIGQTLVKEAVERKNLTAKQPWHTLEQINELIKRSPKK